MFGHHSVSVRTCDDKDTVEGGYIYYAEACNGQCYNNVHKCKDLYLYCNLSKLQACLPGL